MKGLFVNHNKMILFFIKQAMHESFSIRQINIANIPQMGGEVNNGVTLFNAEETGKK